MPEVKYIASPNEIPAGENYVLVMYGEEYRQTKHSLGLTHYGCPPTFKDRG